MWDSKLMVQVVTVYLVLFALGILAAEHTFMWLWSKL